MNPVQVPQALLVGHIPQVPDNFSHSLLAPLWFPHIPLNVGFQYQKQCFRCGLCWPTPRIQFPGSPWIDVPPFCIFSAPSLPLLYCVCIWRGWPLSHCPDVEWCDPKYHPGVGTYYHSQSRYQSIACCHLSLFSITKDPHCPACSAPASKWKCSETSSWWQIFTRIANTLIPKNVLCHCNHSIGSPGASF